MLDKDYDELQFLTMLWQNERNTKRKREIWAKIESIFLFDELLGFPQD